MTVTLAADIPMPPVPPLPMPPWTPGGPSLVAQQSTCPTCGAPVGSLLAACWKPQCLTADATYDARFERYDDQ